MKKSILIAGALLALSASVASAAGINLSWVDCGLAGARNAAFACNTSTNTQLPSAVASFVPPAGIGLFTGIEAQIDVRPDSTTLPPWWAHNSPDPAGCRNALQVTFAPAAGGACLDPYADLGGANGGLAGDIGFGSPDRLRVRFVCGVASPGPVDPSVEYYAFQLQLRKNNTTVAPVCVGCNIPACLVLNQITLYQPDAVGNNPAVTNPIDDNSVTWQSVRVGIDPPTFFTTCVLATPAKSKTWGQVKSLYR